MTKTFHIGLPGKILTAMGIKPGEPIKVKRTIEDIYIFEEQEDPHE
jgi:hypothetical protein